MKAYVDSREPDEVSLRLLKGSAKDDRQHSWDEKELPQGDFYLPEHDVVVERKEASDFASSTVDGRLSEQADRMVAQHDHVYVILENSVEKTYGEGDPYSLYNLRHSNINNNSITGMQTSLAVKRGIKIIYTESVSDTCWAVNRIFERFTDEEHVQADEGYVATSDTGEVDDVQVAMLMQVEGISEEKAREILDIKAFSWYVYMVQEDHARMKEVLMRVDGVGDKLAERVINAFK